MLEQWEIYAVVHLRCFFMYRSFLTLMSHVWLICEWMHQQFTSIPNQDTKQMCF